MIIDKLLTRKGWRVVAHSMLAVAGIGFLHIDQNDYRGHPAWISVKLVDFRSVYCRITMVKALGSMLAKAELSDWR